ncbi:MAG: histidinol-phosphate transaminase [Parvularculaceae bacterium]|nr:histidinol-phosphate transaminase [Parvularculaceae bacterium]
MSGPRPRTGVLDIPLYTPGKSPAAFERDIVKLSANENALGCSPLSRAAFLEAAGGLSLYPDMYARALRDAVGARYGLDPKRLVFGAGSDEIFTLACRAFLSPGDNAVQPEYGFAAWEIATRAAGGEMLCAKERDFHVDVDALLRRVNRRTRLVFVANPANPTGTAISFSEIERLHNGLRKDVLLVLDGAYAEFAGADDYAREFALAAEAQNILVTRTFSKLYGLAALRIGWGFGSAEITGALERVRAPFNTSAPSQAAAAAALADTQFHAQSVAYVEEARADLSSFLSGFGVRVLPSAANFVTILFEGDDNVQARKVESRLASAGVLVRGLRNYAIAEGLRITIGPPESLARFKTAFTEIIEDMRRA